MQTGTENVTKGSKTYECRLEGREQQKAVQHGSADWNGESSKRQCNIRGQTGTERVAKDKMRVQTGTERVAKDKIRVQTH